MNYIPALIRELNSSIRLAGAVEPDVFQELDGRAQILSVWAFRTPIVPVDTTEVLHTGLGY